jgi:phosphoglycerate dehydrogenase-like enzyme
MAAPRVIVPVDALLAPCLDPVAERLSAAGFVVRRPATSRPSEWLDDLAQADVAVLTPRTRFGGSDIDAAARLKGVVFPTIGIEALDLSAAMAAGLVVGNGATKEAIDSMAEANVMLMAALMLDLTGKLRQLRRGGWRDGSVRARMMSGRVVGFVGFGRIARATLARLANWQMRAAFYDPYVEEGAAARYGVVRCPELVNLLRSSDIVMVLTELTAETRRMIGAAEIATMRRDAYLVNTSRGAVVDEEALAIALRNGTIAGAALDAFASEPLPAESPLRGLENVILTPHNVGHTQELVTSFIPATCENVIRIARGDPPLHFANPSVFAKWRQRLARLADGVA